MWMLFLVMVLIFLNIFVIFVVLVVVVLGCVVEMCCIVVFEVFDFGVVEVSVDDVGFDFDL